GFDAGIECDAESGDGCGSGEVCIQGRCYAECTASSCGPGETCVEGVCRGFAGDAGRDGGAGAPAPDGPPDRCATTGCTAPTPYGRAGICVACMTRDDCPPGAPICDTAIGACVAFDPSITECAPCNRDLDCPSGSCVVRDGEQVCLVSPAVGCPPTFVADGMH